MSVQLEIKIWVLWSLQQLRGNSITLIALVGRVRNDSGENISEGAVHQALRDLKDEGLVFLSGKKGSIRSTLTDEGAKMEISKPLPRAPATPVVTVSANNPRKKDGRSTWQKHQRKKRS